MRGHHFVQEGCFFEKGLATQEKEFEPIDILMLVWRAVKRQELPLLSEKIIQKYGLLGYSPLANTQDYKVWNKVVESLEPILQRKNIVSA